MGRLAIARASCGCELLAGTGILHTKPAFVLAVLAIVTGSAAAAQATVAPAVVSSVTRAPRPAAMPGRGGMGATGAAASQRRSAAWRSAGTCETKETSDPGPVESPRPRGQAR